MTFHDVAHAGLRGLVLGVPAFLIALGTGGGRAAIGAWLAFAAAIGAAGLVERALRRTRPVGRVRIVLASAAAWLAVMLGAAAAAAQASLGFLEPVSPETIGHSLGVGWATLWPGGALALAVAGRLLDDDPAAFGPPYWGQRSYDFHSLVTICAAGLASAIGGIAVAWRCAESGVPLRDAVPYLLLMVTTAGPSAAILMVFLPTTLLATLLAGLDRLEARWIGTADPVAE